MIKLFLSCLLFFHSFITSANALSFENKSNYVTISAIPEYKTLTSFTKKLNILYKINITPSMHMYWNNPGDVGEPTKITPLSPNLKIINNTSSSPSKISFENIITSYTHQNTFYIKQQLEFLKPINSPLEFIATYNVCNQECIKESQKIIIDLKKSTTLTPNDLYNKELSIAIKTFPTYIKSYYSISDNTVSLSFDDNIFTNCKTPEFVSLFPKNDILSNLPKTSITSSNNIKITFDNKNHFPQTFQGIILCPNQTYYINPIKKSFSFNDNLLYYILIAFIAGLILNLMPCVLPILSLKALHLIKTNKTTSKLSAFMYLLGVEFCFLTLALIIFYSKKLGTILGWGFQLQSIEFNLFLLFLFFIIFLNLIGKFHFPDKFSNLLTNISKNQSFLTGFFAVIIATPCSGPFMGSAIGYALMSSDIAFFLIFISLGLGYALPYTLIELNPQLFSKYLPKTGSWMLKLKYWLSIPIGLTCLWLGWVILSQFNSTPLTKDLKWEQYSKQKLETLLNAKKPVFINFTAKWCLVCLLNEKTTFSTKEFETIIKENNITLIKADWTTKNTDITQALQKYNRNSIPLYVFYPPNSSKEVILPQILTPKKISEYLNKSVDKKNFTIYKDTH